MSGPAIRVLSLGLSLGAGRQSSALLMMIDAAYEARLEGGDPDGCSPWAWKWARELRRERMAHA